MKHVSHIVGIDEVGRGPIAGPVSVCAVKVSLDMSLNDVCTYLGDSKKLSAQKREHTCSEVLERARVGDISYALAETSASEIDEVGIERAIQKALHSALSEVAPNPAEVFVYLDGRLRAGEAYRQETVIRGDATVPVISLASIIAKVSRDQLMVEASATYPEYGFEQHKGYGTKAHIERIHTYGVCALHRVSFLSKINGSMSA